jgi:hypothetical protein
MRGVLRLYPPIYLQNIFIFRDGIGQSDHNKDLALNHLWTLNVIEKFVIILLFTRV